MKLFSKLHSMFNSISRSLLFVAALCTSFTAYAEPESPAEFVKIFQSGSQVEQEKAAESLSWAGISSPQLFDLIEALALKNLPQSTDKVTINFESHLVKALGYSGNVKYKSTIQKVIDEAPHKKLKKYGKEALNDLLTYETLNPIIAPKSWPENTHPTINQRILNMINSDNTDLMRLGAKRVHNPLNYSPELLAALNSAIERNYANKLNRDRLDTVAWMCRALAGSRSMEYKATIEKVANTAAEKGLQKYARKYLNYYSK